MNLIIPEQYNPILSVRETEKAIKYIRDTFQEELSSALNLTRVSAPLFVTERSGFNDNLNGTEQPVSFTMQSLPGEEIQIVHSLAKWKRYALGHYGFQIHEGLYTNMNAIRKDEDVDNLHSVYVDQWDWERVIAKNERTENILRQHVREIVKVIKHMEHEVWYKFPQAVYHLPDEVTFITSQELLDRYPDLNAKERENAITKEYGCVFLEQIGDRLSNGEKHDGRAPDYDDWALNGDLLYWYEPLQCAFEISSMGIRVDEKSLVTQLEKENCTERLKYPYHKAILNQELPYTIGGGIGQSRLCMMLLGKAHIGEVQCSLWPEEMKKACRQHNIQLL
ncbi:aspartate--ammonia ligase [Catenisphaera adipataccumulans]|uniref:Aspartate--ammonia ligase n=1 Tax=Catenisphaera adipataccumulans TaxID=700500 RepID=A0A7W8CUR0_9FIRM|nr:aspartate--ammonia ligase [Catenisphaera adipataccumulans]MBB5182007.1 aspartate--ammonia ligase [Catenisphaera adipataccumulans]